MSTASVDAAICVGLQKLGLKSLKDKQREAVVSILNNKDTFVSLPTGYEKSISTCKFVLQGAVATAQHVYYLCP